VPAASAPPAAPATPTPASTAPAPPAAPPAVESASAADAPSFAPLAESGSETLSLPRIFASGSAGVPLRLGQDATFDQGTFAPVYTDVMAGYVFAGHGRVRHGAGVGMSLNLSEDGGFTEPVLKYAQFVIMPSYLLDLELDPSWLTLAHAGLPIVVSGGTTAGAEVAFALGYRVLAGCGVFTEASFDVFVGTASTLHPIMSLEAGLFFDYEVLP
jgi:hypothetical protein